MRHVLSDVRPEGGYQDPWAHATLYSKLSSWKEPPRCMFPGEFVALVTRNLNPRWTSCGIASTRFGAADRKFAGLDPHGTVWFASADAREWDISIPAGCIPYSTIKTAAWDEAFGRWNHGEMKRGWRSALEQLVEIGHIRPCDEVSWYIGRNSLAITPKRFGGWKPPVEEEPLDEMEKYARIVSLYVEQQGSTAYGSSEIDPEAFVAKHDYREIQKEVKSYA